MITNETLCREYHLYPQNLYLDKTDFAELELLD